MSQDFDELSRRLEMAPERLANLFAVAGIDTPETNPSVSLAKLSHFLAKKLLPKIQSEMERRRTLVVLERKLAELEQRHEQEFEVAPVLPEFIPVAARIELMHEAFRLRVPHDEHWSALRSMYVEVFFAPPPAFVEEREESWVNQVLTAIAFKRPIKDDAGVEYVNSSQFGAKCASEVSR